MAPSSLPDLSNQLADVVAQVATSVHGRRQPASGIVYGAGVVVTTTRAIGREDGLRVKTADGRVLDAELAGWDPATQLVALRVADLNLAAATPSSIPPRVGHLALAVARSWSNALTASAGIVAVIGGPLPTGRDRAIDEIIRTTAPMHRGFAGGAFVGTDGHLLGVATAAEIRGLGVVIPAAIAWTTVAGLLEHGRARRGYLGVAGQAVQLAPGQRAANDAPAKAVLVVHVIENSPAERAGILVGDILVALDDQPLTSPDKLLEALAGRGGQPARLGVLRGATRSDITVEIGEK